MNLVDNLLSEILKLCQDEWVGDSNPVEILDGENRIPCSLCNTPTKEIYYIVNKISRKKINIGSTCIGEFNKDDLLLFGKSKSQLLKYAKVTYRRKIVNDKYPGISKLVSNWDAELHRYPLLIPYALEKPYLEVGLKLKELVKQFINGKAKNEISEFQMLLDERIELLKLMSEYCDENKNKKFITSRSTVEWLMKNGKNSTVEELKKTGFITAQTIPHVLHKEFIEDIKNDIHKLLLEHANTSLVKIDFLKNEFIVQPHIHNKKLLLKISMQKFLDHFGWLLFGITLKNKPRINLYNIFYLGSCYDDETKLTILRDIKQMLSKSKYTLIYEDEDDYYFANNEIDVADLNSNLRNTVQLNNFVESFKMVRSSPNLCVNSLS